MKTKAMIRAKMEDSHLVPATSPQDEDEYQQCGESDVARRVTACYKDYKEKAKKKAKKKQKKRATSLDEPSVTEVKSPEDVLSQQFAQAEVIEVWDTDEEEEVLQEGKEPEPQEDSDSSSDYQTETDLEDEESESESETETAREPILSRRAKGMVAARDENGLATGGYRYPI